MKPAFLPALLFLLLFSVSHAQDISSLEPQKLYPGYVVTLKGDTLRGLVEFAGSENSRLECNFRQGQKVSSFVPAGIREYHIGSFHFKSVEMQPEPSGIKVRRFLPVVVAGEIDGIKGFEEEDQISWQKGNEAIVTNAALQLNFKKNMLKLVGDNPLLSNKIQKQEKGYRILSLLDIIAEYNKWKEK